jgi:hypothetical protein
LRFIDDDDRKKTAISLTKFALKAMTLNARPTKCIRAVVKNLMKRARSRKGLFPKTLFALSGAGSLRMTVLETCSPDHRCTSMNVMK